MFRAPRRWRSGEAAATRNNFCGTPRSKRGRGTYVNFGSDALLQYDAYALQRL